MKIPVYRKGQGEKLAPLSGQSPNQLSIYEQLPVHKQSPLFESIKLAWKKYNSIDTSNVSGFEAWLFLIPPDNPVFMFEEYRCQKCNTQLTEDTWAILNSTVQLCKKCVNLSSLNA